MTGWIKISRAIQSHWIWQEDAFVKWWLDLLFTANWEDKKTLIGKQLILVKRGQLIAGRTSLSERWGRNKKMVERFLHLLVSEGMIVRELQHNIPIITIVNYDAYQTNGGNPGGNLFEHLGGNLGGNLEEGVSDEELSSYTIVENTVGTAYGGNLGGNPGGNLEEKEKFPPCTPFIKEKEIYKEKEEVVVVVDARTHVREGATLDLRPYQARLEAIAMSCHITPQELDYWIQEFNVHLEAVGETYDDANQYLLRLKNWITKRQEIKRHATNHNSSTREQRYASGINLINGLLAFAHDNKSGGANVSDEIYPF